MHTIWRKETASSWGILRGRVITKESQTADLNLVGNKEMDWTQMFSAV